ncbi:site-specific DNA-methyltransferase [bacterium]|nr:site-specific DNA-methyltransferase [bacterium]
MAKKQKLELTWIGKENRPKLEPRILLEDTTMSYHAPHKVTEDDLFDNRLIFGDNLLALRALEQEFTGKIKCIYIDPPFNIDAAGVPYEDNIENSLWLSLMRSRLEILHRLMTRDGLIFVHIDDEMLHYLAVLMDEIFSKSNRINIIAVKMSEASGVKMSHADKRLPKLKEYILVYKKELTPTITIEKIPTGEWNEEYKTLLVDISKEDISELKDIISKEKCDEGDVAECLRILKKARTISLSKFFKDNDIKEKEQNAWKFDNAWRIIQAVGSSSVLNLAKRQPKQDQEIAAALSATGLIYLYKTDVDPEAKQPRVQVIFADDNLLQNPGDFWSDIKTTGGVGQEGGVLFPNSKKPEALLKRIIGMCTQPGDIVLDSFAGSGTTGAVAHKMKRRWIMVELMEHCHTHVIPRLKSVIDGTDASGITKAVDWRAGGGFRYYYLAPSLLQKDKWDNWVISTEYNAAMLSEAMCKLMGFTYQPNSEHYWIHGHSSESDFIYVTTAVLVKCEWGKDDYSLNVANLQPKPEPENKGNGTPSLFDTMQEG